MTIVLLLRLDVIKAYKKKSLFLFLKSLKKYKKPTFKFGLLELKKYFHCKTILSV